MCAIATEPAQLTSESVKYDESTGSEVHSPDRTAEHVRSLPFQLPHPERRRP
jgi:hypothetical protein